MIYARYVSPSRAYRDNTPADAFGATATSRINNARKKDSQKFRFYKIFLNPNFCSKLQNNEERLKLE